MAYAVEMVSGVIIYIPSFTVWLSHSKVDGGGGEAHRQHGDRISLLIYFKNKGSRLIKLLLVIFPFFTAI
jgi:hypothetical protein